MRKAFLFTMLIFILGGIGASGFGYYKYRNMVDQWYQPLEIKKYAEIVGTQSSNKINEVEIKKEKPLEPFNLLLLGVDSRQGEQKSRSDTIMLASVNPNTNKVSLVSIPRDTLAEIPGHGSDKFNHSMFYGGPSLTKETMEKFFGIHVDHYITVDFEGFTKIVDALGGVEVNVKRRMKYHDPMDGTRIDIQPGLQVLDGKNTLDYARFRKSDIGSAASDFDRMQRQQEVLRKVSEKASNLTTYFKLFTMMDILREHVKTDLREDEIRKLAITFRNFQSSNIASAEIKGINKRMRAHGYNMWFYVVDDQERERIKTIVKQTLSGTIQSDQTSS
ncbi:MAG TPA: LCP family protein [Bacillota bacterium]|nr:LCP family protein [Bacillota bacterium]